MDEVMNSVSVQLQRAIYDAISNQVLPQIQNALWSDSGQTTQKGWTVSADTPTIILVRKSGVVQGVSLSVISMTKML